MSFIHGSDARIFANGVELSAYLQQVSLPWTRDVHDVTTLNPTGKWRRFISGLKGATISGSGFSDEAEDAINERMAAALAAGSQSVFTYLPAGDALSNPAYGLSAIETGWTVEAPGDGPEAVSMDAISDTARERALVLHPLGSEAATGDGTAVNNGASSANGGVGFLQVTSVTAGSITVKVQDSADNIVYADLLTFTLATGRTAQRAEVAGTVDQYVRARHEIATGPAAYHLAFGRR